MDDIRRDFSGLRVSSTNSDSNREHAPPFAFGGARPRAATPHTWHQRRRRLDDNRRDSGDTETNTRNRERANWRDPHIDNERRGDRSQHFDTSPQDSAGGGWRPGRGRGRGRGRGMYGGHHRFGKDSSGVGRPRMLSVMMLRQLIEKEASEIAMYLSSPQNGFVNTINSDNLPSHLIPFLLRVLAKACDCPMSQTLIVLLNDVQDSIFLSKHTVDYVNKMPTEKSGRVQEEFPDSIRNVIRVLSEMFERLPSSYDNLLGPLASLQVTVPMLTALNIVNDESIEKGLEELILLRSDLMMKERTGVINRDQQPRREQSKRSRRRVEEAVVANDPPNNFREINIYPESEDVLTKEQPYIRANIVRGKYQDLEHYLDVQFRLYREDFLAPLREGIGEYIQQQERGNVRHKRIQDIRVYANVEILGPVCTNQGLFHTLQFDISRLKRVNWEFSKRLIFGAFLCLSNDGFRSLFFATVGNRSVKNLQKGMIDVHFVGGTQTVSRLIQQSLDRPFTMVETSAYFEAYHHVLKGLQNIEEGDLPFEEYFLHCRNEVEPPKYMRQEWTNKSTKFDLTPIIELSKSAQMFFDSSSDSEDDDWLSLQLRSIGLKGKVNAENVPLLDLTRWPSADSLGLDTSQLAAVKTALTKEISVIQGPPGTGKTYIGLKIANVLLHNKSVWNKGVNQPLLVVCYTNHALDQFLEGIAEFQKKGIVRAGTRSGSEKLKNFMLNEIKHRNRENRVVPTAIYTSGRASREKMKRIESEIESFREVIDNARHNLLTLEKLSEFMKDEHYMVLKQSKYLAKGTKYSIFHFWLGVVGPDIEQFAEAEASEDDSESDEDSEDENETQQNDRSDQQNAASDSINGAGAIVDTEAGMLQAERFTDTDIEVYSTNNKQKKTKTAKAEASSRKQSSKGRREDEWVRVENKKKVKKRITAGLRGKDSMLHTEATRVHSVWQLTNQNRWRLYRYWVSRYTEYFQDRIKELEKKFEDEAKQLEEIKFEEDLEILKQAVVIGMTTTGAARYRSILQRVKPKIIIVEEAAEVLEAHVITTLTSSCEQLILIGDHKQLRPNPTVYKLAKDFNLDYSLFERMVSNGMHCDSLEIQHRMRPEIAVLMDHIYDNLQNHESVYNYETVKGVASNIFFINHDYLEVDNEELLSHANEHEALYVTALCRYMLLQGYDSAKITVLTTYKGQLFKLKGLMRNKHIFDNVRVTAVDNFQGEENDIIILSLVRSNKEGRIGFLATENRVCVALSRARVGFYCIGNISLLAKHSNLWQRIKDDMKSRGYLGKALSLHCQNHPHTTIEAKSSNDFRAAPEGGCTQPCEARLSCGHVCMYPCHPGDPNHEKYKCRKPCIKTVCDLKHKCPKRCFEECGPCMTKVEKVIPQCKHIQDVPCSVEPRKFMCLEACTKILQCGHKCQNICGVTCTSSCRVEVTRQWPCGHEVTTYCYRRPENYPCPTKCEAILGCEHPCVGTCGECKRGRLHVQCQDNCGRTLVCSHACMGNCSAYCPPCIKPCENRCVHSRCRHKCGMQCKKCAEPCQWRCRHYRCTNLCGDLCNRPPCNRPCFKILACGHQCIGLCGEPCPGKCRICDKEEVTELLFGDEDEPNARFIELEDCKHVIEVTGLDRWMSLEADESQSIQLKTCPKCKTPIRKNLRYGNIIKRLLADIGEVKQKILGNQSLILEKAQELTETMETSEFLDEFNDSVKQQISNLLVRPDYLSLDTVQALETQIKNLEVVSELNANFSRDLRDAFALKGRLDLRARMDANKYEEIADEFVTWLMTWKYEITDQALKDCATELSRINLIARFYILEAGIRAYSLPIDENRKKTLHRLRVSLNGGALMSPSKIDAWSEYVKKVHSSYSVLQPLNEELKAQINKALKLQKGHWFKCPKGHYYVIGDCGGATETSTCPDCGSTVGGTSHNLAAGNAHAPEMDGSRYAAYSEAANMDPRNFNLDDFM